MLGYDVTNKTKDYLLVPVKITSEMYTTSSSADPSYSVMGMVAYRKDSIIDYFVMAPKETLQGQISYPASLSMYDITVGETTPLQKSWVQDLEQAFKGDKDKIAKYLNDEKAKSAHTTLKLIYNKKFGEELKDMVSVKFLKAEDLGTSWSVKYELENKSKLDLSIGAHHSCFSKKQSMSALANSKSTVSLTVSKAVACTPSEDKLIVDKVQLR